MVSGIAIKCTNRISSYSLLQNYKMYNMVSCRTVNCMDRLRYYSSLQNYEMQKNGKNLFFTAEL
jgi:hypothetical protein